MKTVMFGLLMAASVFAVSSTAFANSDDAKWVARCLKDNSDAKVGVEVVTKYCTCMNNKMSDNETQSITKWEKTHKTEREACEKEAGWN
ncbi:MAG TPA: hypothetical protein VIJ42_14930 [Stellaceae bacterium]